MEASLDAGYQIVLVLTLWVTSVGLGMALTVRDLAAPLRRVGLFGRVVALDCVALPLFVWALVEVLSIRQDYAIGLVLVGRPRPDP